MVGGGFLQQIVIAVSGVINMRTGKEDVSLSIRPIIFDSLLTGMVVVGIYEQGPLFHTVSVMPHPISSLLLVLGDADLVDE